MTDLLSRISTENFKIDSQVWVCLAFIWLVVAGCAVSSVFSQSHSFTRKQRVFWMLLVLGLPVAGLMIYLPFSLADKESILLMSLKRKE